MLKNKTWYFVLYFLSFCVSTGVFHTVASAQEVTLTSINDVKLVTPVTNLPTPTAAQAKTLAVQQPTITITATSSPEPTDNPVIIEAKTNIPTATLTPLPPTATPEPTATPTPQTVAITPIPVAKEAGSLSEEAITYLGACEAGNDPTKNTGNGYYGAFQFSYGTWQSLNTGYERADMAPLEVQRAAVKQLLSRSNIFNQFPGCASKMRAGGLI